jgi:hypothetical protein
MFHQSGIEGLRQMRGYAFLVVGVKSRKDFISKAQLLNLNSTPVNYLCSCRMDNVFHILGPLIGAYVPGDETLALVELGMLDRKRIQVLILDSPDAAELKEMELTELTVSGDI